LKVDIKFNILDWINKYLQMLVSQKNHQKFLGLACRQYLLPIQILLIDTLGKNELTFLYLSGNFSQ